MNLEELQNKSILLFGKPRAFNEAEFSAEMNFHKIDIVHDINDDVVMVVDGRMMTPYEQNKSDELYELHNGKIEFISIDILEKEIAKNIDASTLLMSLKLSHDKERLKSFIQNSCLNDEVFLKLLTMYDWDNENFFENNDNRDVSAAFISRFYKNIERNHNVQYATTGYTHLIKQLENVEILKAILGLQPIKFNENMKVQMAQNPFCDSEIQKYLKKENFHKIDEALSQNEKLEIELVKEFLKDEVYAQNVAKNIALSDEMFELCFEQKVALSLNKSLNKTMQEKLFKTNDDGVLYALSLNENIDEEILKKLLELKNEEILFALYENKMMPSELLEVAYNNGKYHAQLARNESTSIEILYQLNLDSRYERSVKENPAFGQHIQIENLGWL